MDKKRAKQVKADVPLSITDGAPRIIEVAGAKARIPAAMDYRIAARVAESLGEDGLDDEDVAILMLYLVLHHTPKQIGDLWRKSRDPLKLWQGVQMWLASMPIEQLTKGCNELAAYESELEEQADLDDCDDGGADEGKKKTTSR